VSSKFSQFEGRDGTRKAAFPKWEEAAEVEFWREMPLSDRATCAALPISDPFAIVRVTSRHASTRDAGCPIAFRVVFIVAGD
jgi:hypothetical protein